MHVSLDGFVGGPNGEMDWIAIDDEMFEYAGERTKEADTALYGRKTYEMMESYWPTAADQPKATKHDIEHSAWYNKVTKIVLSKTMKGTNLPKTKIISDNVINEITQLKQSNGKDILMFGSPSVAYLLTDAGLIDDYWLFVNPVILGEGIPLFKDIKNKISLKHVKSIPLPSGVVCLHYGKNITH